MSEMQRLLQHTVTSNGSDLHISAGSPIMIRVHGQMQKLDEKPVSADIAQNLISQILNPQQVAVLKEEQEVDFAISVPDYARFRVNVFQQRLGLAGVFRVIPEKIPSIEELGLPSVVGDLVNLEYGLILVTGPTGMGKSTTLAAMIDRINSTKKGHIITIEDPIEFIHSSQKCIINQREVTSHTHSFANALRSALREDPDYILVGEMRDLETIGLALTAAETGHLVFATLHTSSAAKTITRVIDVFPVGEQDRIRIQLSESLMGVIAQRLYPRIDIPGRIAAFELMIATQAVRNLIREKKIFQIDSVIQTSRSIGMQSMEQAKRDLIAAGKVSKEFLQDTEA
jgi:twitching motility protein PilT